LLFFLPSVELYLKDSFYVAGVWSLFHAVIYIGVFYHALLHRSFMTLRQVLVQRVNHLSVIEQLLLFLSGFANYR
jgi:anoctamin-10